MAAKPKPLVKINKKTGNKEFKNYFHFVGKVKPVRKQDADKKWNDVPYFKETLTKESKKPRRVLTFSLETALSNDLKIELNGMEMKSVYPYSSTSGKSVEVPWANRFDKSTFPDNTYNVLGGTDWDNAEEYAKLVDTDKWVEVKGYYEFSNYTPDEGTPMVVVKRFIKELNEVVDGQEIKIDKDNAITYVTDFKSPEFKEVNQFNLQIGIRSTIQNEETGNTTVNAVVLTYGKEKSVVQDAVLTVYQSEVADGKVSLANAFATLEETDFIEVIGVDNNRATFIWRDVVEDYAEHDPFADVPVEDSKSRQEQFVNGEKKGLEITGFVQKTKLLEYLTLEEMTNNAPASSDPFGTDANEEVTDTSNDPFA